MSFYKLGGCTCSWNGIMWCTSWENYPPCQIFQTIAKKKKPLGSSCWPLCLHIHPFAWNNLASTGWFLWNFMLAAVLPTYQTTFKFDVIGTVIMGTYCENVCTFKSLILIMGMDCVLYEIWAEAEETDDDNLKITTETGCDICEVWAGNWKQLII